MRAEERVSPPGETGGTDDTANHHEADTSNYSGGNGWGTSGNGQGTSAETSFLRLVEDDSAVLGYGCTA